MEYGITAAVMAVFIVIYLFSRPRFRVKPYRVYGEQEYSQGLKNFIYGLPLPKTCGSKLQDKVFKRKLIVMRFMTKYYQKCAFLEQFGALISARKEEIAAVVKFKYDSLSSLPSVEGEPRTVKIARFALAHSDYIFSLDRAGAAMEEQNRRRALTVSEINAMKDAFRYVLSERLAFCAADAHSVFSMSKKAEKFAKHYKSCEHSPLYKSLTQNNMFMRFTAVYLGADTEWGEAEYAAHAEKQLYLVNTVLDSLKSIEYVNFNRFYKPIEYLDDFECFASAQIGIRQNFLNAMSALSDRENMDESVYAKRLCDFARNSDARAASFTRKKFAGRRIICQFAKENDVLLARSLTNCEQMRLNFAPVKRKKRSSDISEGDIGCAASDKSSRVYESFTAKFGISLIDDYLKIQPNFPDAVTDADITLEHKGVDHKIHVRKGDEDELSVGGTILHGIPGVILGDKPLDITVTVKRE